MKAAPSSQTRCISNLVTRGANPPAASKFKRSRRCRSER